METGARAVYLKSFLLSRGLPVGGETVKEVIANFDAIKRSVKVSKDIDEKIDLYRGMGGNRWTDEMKLSRPVEVDEAPKIPPAEVESVSAQNETEFGLSPLVGDEIDTRPYFIRNYSYSFRRIFWGEKHPEPRVDFSASPFVMDQYGFATVQKGSAVYIGVPAFGDAVLALLNPDTGIGTVARIPYAADLDAAVDAAREHAREIARRSLNAAGKVRRNIVAKKLAAIDEINSPYAFEIARMLVEQKGLVPEGDEPSLRAALLFFSGSEGVGLAMAADLIGAAHLAGIMVVDVAELSAREIYESGLQVHFESEGGRLLLGEKLLASVANAGDLAAPILKSVGSVLAKFKEMGISDEDRAYLEEFLIPSAIGAWGREPFALEAYFGGLLGVAELQDGGVSALLKKERRNIAAGPAGKKKIGGVARGEGEGKGVKLKGLKILLDESAGLGVEATPAGASGAPPLAVQGVSKIAVK